MVSERVRLCRPLNHRLATRYAACNPWLRRWFRLARHDVHGCRCARSAVDVAVCSGARDVVVPVRISLCSCSIRRSGRRHAGSSEKSRLPTTRSVLASGSTCSSTRDCGRSRPRSHGSAHRYRHRSAVQRQHACRRSHACVVRLGQPRCGNRIGQRTHRCGTRARGSGATAASWCTP